MKPIRSHRKMFYPSRADVEATPIETTQVVKPRATPQPVISPQDLQVIRDTQEHAVRILCAMVQGVSVVGGDTMRRAAQAAYAAAAELAGLTASTIKARLEGLEP